MRRRAVRGSVVIALAVTAAWLGAAPGRSWAQPDLPLQLVPFLQALLGRALPGGRVDVREGFVVWPDGRQERYALTRADAAFAPGEWVWITTLRLPDRRAGSQETLAGSPAQAPSAAACRVIVIAFRAPVPGSIPPVPTVLDYREATPDVAGHTGECQAHLAVGSADAARAAIVVGFASAHYGTQGPTLIEWRAVLDRRTMTWRSRIPVTITRHRLGGATWEDIGHEDLPPEGTRFTGETSGRVLAVPCALSTCKVPPEAVLRAFR